MTIRNCIAAPLIILFLLANKHTLAQQSSFPVNEWVKKLADKNDHLNKGYQEIDSILFIRKDPDLAVRLSVDSINMQRTMEELEEKERHQNIYYSIRFKLLKARMLWIRSASQQELPAIKRLMTKATSQCYALNDELVTAFISWQFGSLMSWYGQFDLATLYCLNGAELFKKHGISMQRKEYVLLGNVLYYTRGYKKSIYYTRQAIAASNLSDTSFIVKVETASAYNTIGLCFRKMINYDSAFFYFDSALHYANIPGYDVWKGIILGNKAQIYFEQKQYDTAKALFEYEYVTSAKAGETADAANALQWLARISLLEDENNIALQHVKKAKALLSEKPYAYFLQNIYQTTADVYRALSIKDSALLFTQLYNHIKDSLELAAATSRMEVSAIRLENMTSAFKIEKLQSDIQAETLKRNFIILAIILISAFIILYFNRKSIKARLKEQRAEQQRQVMEEEVKSAREQMQVFTQNIIEKTTLIEKLEQELGQNKAGAGQQLVLAELAEQAILTEEDWYRFRVLFEKLHPAFFDSLINSISGITLAEQRMAALVRLHLTNKHMASVLGISANSVIKTKSRLRHRLNMQTDAEVLEFIAKL
ncbi:MAG TPA: tetratricopeptide repeat protein [Parafilimonas sp.]|nr:tetratricopeptide repeat protein [Parafilimonas sp.]